MNTKLTLSIDKKIINEAKKYAKKRHKSVSKIVENYLKNIIAGTRNGELTPIVSELAGSVKNYNDSSKEDYAEYLTEKYR